MNNLLFTKTSLLVIAFIFFSKAYAEEKNLIFDVYPFNEDDTINAIIEIPAGTLEKWEITKDGRKIEQTIANNQIRTIDYLAYPFNYGFIPQTLLSTEKGGDGNQLDIIVIGPTVKRGSIIKVKPIATIIVLNNNEINSMVISIAINDLAISKSNSISDLQKNYLGLFEIVKIWVENYKGEAIEIKNTLGKNTTKKYINKYHQNFLTNLSKN